MLLDVVEHFEDDRAVLVSARSLLRAGGLLLVTVPSMPSLWSGYDVRCGHARRYCRRTLLDLLGSCGFTPVFASHFMFFLAPLLFAHRKLYAKSAPEDSSDEAEFNPGRFVSSIMKAFLCIEVFIISRGYRLPWGSSLIVAAVPSRR
jgi:hypothetical protein